MDFKNIIKGGYLNVSWLKRGRSLIVSVATRGCEPNPHPPKYSRLILKINTLNRFFFFYSENSGNLIYFEYLLRAHTYPAIQHIAVKSRPWDGNERKRRHEDPAVPLEKGHSLVCLGNMGAGLCFSCNETFTRKTSIFLSICPYMGISSSPSHCSAVTSESFPPCSHFSGEGGSSQATRMQNYFKGWENVIEKPHQLARALEACGYTAVTATRRKHAAFQVNTDLLM